MRRTRKGWLRLLGSGFALLTGLVGMCSVRAEETGAFLAARKEPRVVVLQGQVAKPSLKARWAEAARLANAGLVVDQVRTGTAVDPDATWIPAAVSHLPDWLAWLEEGEIRWAPGRLSLTGSAASVEAAARLRSAATRALPETWVLDDQVQNLDVRQRVVLKIRWEDGAMLCDGLMPQQDWQVRKAAWTADPSLQLVIRDRVGESSAPAPEWFEGFPAFLKQFQSEVRGGQVEIESSTMVLRGRVNDLMGKLRAGREARAVVGRALEVRNFLEVDASPRAPDAIIAAATPPPAPVTPPVKEAQPQPEAKLAAMAPPPAVSPPAPVPVVAAAPAPAKAAPKAPSRAAMITIVADANGLRVNGDLPDRAVKTTIAGSCAAVPGNRKVADRTEVTAGVCEESWHAAIPDLLEAISEHLEHGEFRIEEGRATLSGVAKSAPGRDRLLAVLARALPDAIHLDDRTSVPVETKVEGFSRNIFFNTGSTYIKPEHREHLRELVTAVKSSGGELTILIKGYADPRGDPELNEKLSRERAKAVFDSLAKQGVSPKAVEFVAVGAAESGDGTGEYVWKQERRVELTLVK